MQAHQAPPKTREVQPPTKRVTDLGAVDAGAASVADVGIEMVGRNCGLHPYKSTNVRSFSVAGTFIAYASPDSTYAVTKQMFDKAEKSILIGIYDFTADYVKGLLLQAMERGVKVSLMLDIDSAGEQTLYDDLAKHGAECVPAPSCASDYAHYFASSHEKVIVIDGRWVMVQSGNYSVNSAPLNEHDGEVGTRFRFGNRDMGVAIDSPELAKFFTKVLRSDMKLETDGEHEAGVQAVSQPLPEMTVLTAAPKKVPKLFHSLEKQSRTGINITPVLSPDNYMDVVPELLRSAKRSIYIEQQYIKTGQPHIQELLEAIHSNSHRPQVKIILAKPLSTGKELQKDIATINALAEYELRMGTNVRILNPDYFVHCHNKLIVIDESVVLVSSQNWSDFAVSKNREAGLVLEYPELAAYYAEIFNYDWKTGLNEVPKGKPKVFAVESLNSGQRMVRLNWGDYVEV